MPGVERVRFTTSHPLNFSDTLVEAFAHTRKLANHAPAGAERIRSHSCADASWLYGAGVQTEAATPEGGAARHHDFTISSWVFPETERDFQQTLDLCAEARQASPSALCVDVRAACGIVAR